MRLERVIWRDAYFEKDEGKTYDDYLMETVGWVDLDGRWLVIRGERDLVNEGYRSVTRIPIANIVKRKKVK